MSKQLSKYGKGMFIKKKDFTNKATGKEFFVYKLGIRKDEFLENPFNENGWCNFEIRFNSNNEPYIVIDAPYNNIYSTVNTEDTTDSKALENNDGNEEIPF